MNQSGAEPHERTVMPGQNAAGQTRHNPPALPQRGKATRKGAKYERVRHLLRKDLVVVAPVSDRKLRSSARSTARKLMNAGAFLFVVSFISTYFLSEVVPEPVSLGGMWAAVALFLVNSVIERLVNRRERKLGVLTAGEIMDAPEPLALPLLAALDSADKVRDSVAFRDGWLSDVDLDAALWELARHVKAGSQLHESLAKAHSVPDQLDRAQATFDEYADRLTQGAENLAALALRATAFDLDLATDSARGALAVTEPALEVLTERAAAQFDAYETLPKEAS